MPSPFTAAGAASDPSRAAPLHTNRFFTGLWTQRSPLRDAATPFLYEKFYSASRYDSLIGGVNTEVTTHLTLARRPGHTFYNSALGANTVKRLYPFRVFVNGIETIKVLADVSPDVGHPYGTVRDVTGPVGDTILWVKLAGSGRTCFQSVGNELFFVDGVSANKWVLSSVARQPSTTYTAGTFVIDTGNFIQAADLDGDPEGVTGTAASVAWNETLGGTTIDGGITWVNKGLAIMPIGIVGPTQAPYLMATPLTLPGPWEPSTVYTAHYSGPLPRPPQKILDSNGNIEQCTVNGTSGTTAPTWPATGTQGAFTSDGTTQWQSVGTAGLAQTAPVYYAYAWGNSITGHISTASPISSPSQWATDYGTTVQGLYGQDPQDDTIIIYRTTQGGSTLLFLNSFPNVYGSTSQWSYLDSAPDSALNELIQARIASSNNPPPAGLSTLDYHLGCLWGFVNNVLYYSNSPVANTGSNLESWPPLQSYTYPSKGVRTWATSIGLVVFTLSDVFVVLGSNTSASPLYTTSFQTGVGLLNYDCFAVNGSTAYLMTTAQRLISFDPSAGETEVGFPIGDLLTSYTAAGAWLAYHEGSSADTGLYAGDGTVGWYRMSAISAPESGQVWSPQAAVVGGVGTAASIEITPGLKKLLVAQLTPGPLLYRDATTSTDNGTAYPASTIIGSIVLAQPGQLAGIYFLTCDSVATGTRPKLGLLMGEIAGTFDLLLRNRQDPPRLPPATTLWGDRYYMSQNQTVAWCRHMQVQIEWATEAAANELLTYTIFGEIRNDEEVV